MGHYVSEVEQRTTEFCSVEILIMMLPMLPYLSQLRLTTYADSAEYLTSWFQDFIYIKKTFALHFECRDYCSISMLYLPNPAPADKENWRKIRRWFISEDRSCVKSYSCVSPLRHGCQFNFKSEILL